MVNLSSLNPVFISYGRDEPATSFSRKLHDELESSGINVWLDVVDIKGRDWDNAIQEALLNCFVLLFVLTDKSRKSEICIAEFSTVYMSGKRVIPILIEAETGFDKLPTLINKANGIDFREDFNRAFAELRRWLNDIASNEKHTSIEAQHKTNQKLLPEPGILPEVGVLPPGSRMFFARNAAFSGRESDLQTLAGHLLYSSKENSQVAAVVGVGGIGKTQLTVEFVYRFGRYFAGVHWINTLTDIEDEIAECGRKMMPSSFPDNLKSQVDLTLKMWRSAPFRVVVFDNIEEPEVLRNWLPQLGGVRILLTSRRGRWEADLGINTIHLSAFSPSSGRTLLRKLAPHLADINDYELDAILLKLGHMPLAIDLVGRYLADSFSTPKQWLEELSELGGVLQHPSLVNWVDKKRSSPTDHETHLAASWLISYRRLLFDHKVAADSILPNEAEYLFCCCGFLAPNQPITRDLLASIISKREKTNSTIEVRNSVTRALSRLVELGLVTQESDGSISIHPLLAEFSRTQYIPGKNLLNELISAVIEEANKTSKENSSLQKHIIVLSTWAISESSNIAPEVSEIIKEYFVEHIGQSQTFATLGELAEIDETRIAALVPLVSSSAYRLRDLGNMAEAKSTLENALNMSIVAFGEDNPNTATILNNLGGILHDLGDLNAAKAAYERALKIDEMIFGPHHPNVAVLINNLGTVYSSIGDLSSAKVAYERALRIDEAAFGTNHPNVTTRLNNLGQVLSSLGDLSAAKTVYKRALRTSEEIYGSEHPNIAQIVINLGVVHFNMTEYLAALELFERALHINEAAFGPQHPVVAQVIVSMANTKQSLRDFEEAKRLYELALAILRNVYPPNHPAIIAIQENLRDSPPSDFVLPE